MASAGPICVGAVKGDMLVAELEKILNSLRLLHRLALCSHETHRAASNGAVNLEPKVALEVDLVTL